jgi:Flp pilus assembly protein TadG
MGNLENRIHPAAPTVAGPGRATGRRKQRGSALVELTLLAPWVFFLFVGVIDLGFYYYSLIAVENAARVAAEATSKTTALAGSTSTACTKVLAELGMLPNLSGVSTCTSSPLVVTATSGNGPDGNQATTVSVTYSLSMIPIPGLLMGALNVTRITQMRVTP